jgi:hypothetical protein
MKICASQKTAVLKGLQPSNSNRQASFRKTMSACRQLFPGYVHGGIVAIQPPKSLWTKPNAPFFASTLLAAIQNLPLDEVRSGHGSVLKVAWKRQVCITCPNVSSTLTGYYHTGSKRTQRFFFLMAFRIPKYLKLIWIKNIHIDIKSKVNKW